MTRQYGNHRKLRFESLETRDLLAGNVAAEVIEGNLFLTGDDLDNGLTIDQTETGDLRITGEDSTTINEQDDPAVMSGVGSVIAQLGDGNDNISVRDAEIAGDFIVQLGDGGWEPVSLWEERG